MEILIMHQTVASHDAIGNDIEAMYGILSEKFSCLVYAEYKLNQNVRYADNAQMKRIIARKDSLIVYHHSIFWEYGQQILKKAKGKIVFRYHNITPASFFQTYHPFYATQCQKGRRQTEYFISTYPDAYWMPDSAYNARDLSKVSRDKIGICAPFHKIGWHMGNRPDERILKELLENKKINLLFVGRICPNKGHLFLTEILRVFVLNYHHNIRLRIAGKFDAELEPYNELLRQKIRQYHLNPYIEFVGEATDAALTAYYLGSDLFLCASEHEGFCVPILEAQNFGLPVLALHAGAVPDTGGNGQLLLQKRAVDFAAAIKVLMDHKDYYRQMQKCGMKNFRDRYTYEQMKCVFEKEIGKIIGV